MAKKASPTSTTSRPAAKPPPAAGPDDPRWLPAATFHGWLTERSGNRDLAANDLTQLVRTTVHTMQRYLDRNRRPDRPDLEWEQLPFSHWNERALTSWSAGLRVTSAKQHGVGAGIPAFGLYVWGPNCEAFRPAFLGPGDNTGARSIPRQPSGPKTARGWQDHVLREIVRAFWDKRPEPTASELAQSCIERLGIAPETSAITRFLRNVRDGQ